VCHSNWKLEYLVVYSRVSMGECAPRKCRPKFTKIFRRMLLHKTPNHAKFYGDRLKMSEISAIENLCSPKKWATVHQNFFRGCYPVRPPIMPNFIEISQTSLDKSVKKCYLFGPSRHFFCHGQTET